MGYHLHSWVEGEDSKVSCPRKQGDDRARSWIPFFASEARWPKQYTNAPRRRSFEHLPLNLWFLERGTWNIALGFSGPKISHSVIMFRYFMIYPLTNHKCRFFSFLSFSLSSFLHRGFVGFYATLTGELISVWNLVYRSARFLSFRYDRGLWIKGKKSRFAYFQCTNTLRLLATVFSKFGNALTLTRAAPSLACVSFVRSLCRRSETQLAVYPENCPVFFIVIFYVVND